MCAPSSLSQASTQSKRCHPVTNLSFVFLSFFTLNYCCKGATRRRLRLAWYLFYVSCGKKLAGRYCSQCGEDSQSTADAQSQVPVLTTVMIPGPGKQGKGRRSKDCTSAVRDTSKSKGSAAGGISVAQASGQVLESLPAAVTSRASPQAAAFIQTAAQGAKKSGKVHAGPGRPPAKTYEATDADKRGTSRRRLKTLISLHLRKDNGNNMWSLHFLPRVHLPRATSCMRCISYSRKMPSVHISLT